MSVSFGLKASTPKRRGAAPLAAFTVTEEDENEAVLSEVDKLAESERLQSEGNVAADAEKYSSALRAWDKAIRLTPARAVLHEQKAQVFLQLDRYWDAVQCASQAAALESGWADAFLTLGRAQLGLGEPELALKSMETALQLKPDLQEAQNEIAEVRVLVLQRQQQPSAVSKRI